MRSIEAFGILWLLQKVLMAAEARCPSVALIRRVVEGSDDVSQTEGRIEAWSDGGIGI
jgi:hypothetical protein